MAKERTSIPRNVAARVLFAHDRTCCVCREPGKVVQIHHINENPSQHHDANLAVLCFDCHHLTQLSGGFDRKLDADQVILYRDDWVRVVQQRRASTPNEPLSFDPDDGSELEVATSVAEIYRERQQYDLLAIHYHKIGNTELRDKYIELALDGQNEPAEIVYLRALQGRPDLIPAPILDRALEFATETGAEQRGRMLHSIGRPAEAVADYVRGIGESLTEGNTFAAAFYLKELAVSGLIDDLFLIALEHFKQEGSLWWQARALQELGDTAQLAALLSEHSAEIETGNDAMLKHLYAEVAGTREQWVSISKQIARASTSFPGGVAIALEPDPGNDDEAPKPKTRASRKPSTGRIARGATSG